MLLLACSFHAFGEADKIHLPSLLKQVSVIQKSVEADLRDVDLQIRNTLVSSASNGVRSPSLQIGPQRMEHLEKDRAEFKLRQEFLDRLTSQIVTNAKKASDVSDLISSSIMEMAVVESMSPNPNRSLRMFLTNLAAALKDGAERKDNVFTFIESYMKFSSILQPKDPGDFLSNRNYTNGKESQSAAPLGQDEVGDRLEVKKVGPASI